MRSIPMLAIALCTGLLLLPLHAASTSFESTTSTTSKSFPREADLLLAMINKGLEYARDNNAEAFGDLIKAHVNYGVIIPEITRGIGLILRGNKDGLAKIRHKMASVFPFKIGKIYSSEAKIKAFREVKSVSIQGSEPRGEGVSRIKIRVFYKDGNLRPEDIVCDVSLKDGSLGVCEIIMADISLTQTLSDELTAFFRKDCQSNPDVFIEKYKP